MLLFYVCRRCYYLMCVVIYLIVHDKIWYYWHLVSCWWSPGLWTTARPRAFRPPYGRAVRPRYQPSQQRLRQQKHPHGKRDLKPLEVVISRLPGSAQSGCYDFSFGIFLLIRQWWFHKKEDISSNQAFRFKQALSHG